VSAAALAPGPKKKFSALYVIIPLLLIAVVGIAVAWENFRARMEQAQQGQGGEERLGMVDGPMGMTRERKSRELKPKEEPAPMAPVTDEELTGLGKKKKPPPPKVYPPAERAWRAVKADYDKLQGRNETTARKYRIRILAMGDRKDTQPEAAFIKEAASLEAELKDELAKPENQ
jgi:hypothetical protein